MTIHIPVRPPRIVALGGPVSAAIRAMRADEPATDYARIRELRRAIADRIEADIALLDALDPFRDELEADFTAYAPDGLTLVGLPSDFDQDAGEECEIEDEHGGDIQDEPHDPEEDKGAEEDEGFPCPVTFDGTNYGFRHMARGRQVAR